MAQLESLRQENQFFREMVASSSGVATGHPANDPESLNGQLLVSIQERLLNIESELGRLGKKMDTHQEGLQELWYSQAPVPNVQEPVFRMDEKDNEGFFGWDEGPQWNPGQEGQEVQSSAGSSEDVEKRSLRTKDLHHLNYQIFPMMRVVIELGGMLFALQFWRTIKVQRACYHHGWLRLSRQEVLRLII